MNSSYSVHAPLECATVWVKEDLFYNLETNTQNWVKCKVFGLACVAGIVPTFEILTPEGYVFSDVPPHMIRWSEPNTDIQHSLEDLVYNNCLSEQFALSLFPELKARAAHVFLRGAQQYIGAQYWFSVDFYNHNNWFHAMKLDNGQIAFAPSHKIVFNNAPLSNTHVFPAYKKLRHEFKV